MANLWQIHGKSKEFALVANARFWQKQGKSMADSWQIYGKTKEFSCWGNSAQYAKKFVPFFGLKISQQPKLTTELLQMHYKNCLGTVVPGDGLAVE